MISEGIEEDEERLITNISWLNDTITPYGFYSEKGYRFGSNLDGVGFKVPGSDDYNYRGFLNEPYGIHCLGRYSYRETITFVYQGRSEEGYRTMKYRFPFYNIDKNIEISGQPIKLYKDKRRKGYELILRTKNRRKSIATERYDHTSVSGKTSEVRIYLSDYAIAQKVRDRLIETIDLCSSLNSN